ncbi:MAG: accessory gene regulator B family protein [Clostridia bacterium]|nr:accessory gene regulator B family protein [Clostridia bacterium]
MKNHFLSDLPEEEREIVEYGLNQGLILVGGLGLAVIAGWLMGIPVYAVLFLALTYGLRIYAGGYHAKTPLRCGIVSTLSILICFLCLKYVTLPPLLLHFLTFGAGLFLLCTVPVDTANKELEAEEKQVYGRKARQIVLGEAGIYLVSSLLGWETGIRCVSVCLIFMAVNIAFGLANRRQRRRQDNDENPDL